MTASKRAFLMTSTALWPRRRVAQAGDGSAVWGWSFGGLLGLAVGASGVFSIVNGPTMRANAEAIIEQENRIVCSKLGIGPETNRYPECAAALSVVRASNSQRDAQSIL